MKKLPKRKLIRVVMDAAIASALMVILKGEKKLQVLKNKVKTILT